MPATARARKHTTKTQPRKRRPKPAVQPKTKAANEPHDEIDGIILVDLRTGKPITSETNGCPECAAVSLDPSSVAALVAAEQDASDRGDVLAARPCRIVMPRSVAGAEWVSPSGRNGRAAAPDARSAAPGDMVEAVLVENLLNDLSRLADGLYQVAADQDAIRGIGKGMMTNSLADDVLDDLAGEAGAYALDESDIQRTAMLFAKAMQSKIGLTRRALELHQRRGAR